MTLEIKKLLSVLLQEVMNPSKGFIKDDTLLLRARLVYPDLDAHVEPLSSTTHSSQGHSSHTPSAPYTTQSLIAPPTTHSSQFSSPSHSKIPPAQAMLQVSNSASNSQSQPFSQSSQELENSELTPSSTSVLPSEMTAFLFCPACAKQYETDGKKSPNTLTCGHTFCLGGLS